MEMLRKSIKTGYMVHPEHGKYSCCLGHQRPLGADAGNVTLEIVLRTDEAIREAHGVGIVFDSPGTDNRIYYTLGCTMHDHRISIGQSEFEGLARCMGFAEEGPDHFWVEDLTTLANSLSYLGFIAW